MPDWVQVSLIIFLIVEFLYTLPMAYPLYLIIGFWFLAGYLFEEYYKNKDYQDNSTYQIPESQSPPNPNPYSLAELQNHLDNYRRKAIENGDRDKWKYGRDYERYIGYLWEKNGWKVKYNGATKGNYDGGIDLICTKNDEVCLIQCKRWKNRVGSEEIKQFQAAIERYEEFETDSSYVEGFFYSTSGYTDDAYEVAEWNDIECCTEKFNSVKEYPPVKCINSHGSKIYFLPFDKSFDRVPEKWDHLDCYKFTIVDAEKAGYHYHLNSGILLKVPPPKVTRNVESSKNSYSDDFIYWNNDKNYVMGYVHAGYIEIVDITSCRIVSLVENQYTLFTKYIGLQAYKSDYKKKENTRVFRFKNDGTSLPEVLIENEWRVIPNGRDISDRESCAEYIANQMPYEYKMFKIVYYKIFGKKYLDNGNFLKINQTVERPQPQNNEDSFYWNGNKNYPIGFYHAGFAEFVDLKSCKIISYKEDETGGAYILSARYIKISPFQKGYVENTRVFRYYKDSPILPEVQMINRWVTIPAHDEESKRVALEFPFSYIEKYLPYEYEMFKIVHFRIFGEEYTDDFKSNKIIESEKFQVEKNIPYWNGDKNYPVGYYHAGYFEYINLKSCKITSYINGEYTFSASFISVVQNSVVSESTRIFRYGRGLPKVYKNNEWIVIPKYREFKNGEGYINYIDIQMLYSYTMFKIVHYKLLGKEYTDTCKYGWHYDKGYPEYR